MRTRRQENKNKQRRDLSLEDDYQQQTKLQMEDSALSNFLRGRSTFKNREEEAQYQRRRPPARQTFKEEKEKSYSFIDELTSLIGDDARTNLQQQYQNSNRLRRLENWEQDTSRRQRNFQPKSMLTNRMKHSPVLTKIDEDSVPRNKNNKRGRDELTRSRQPLIGRERYRGKYKKELISTVNRREMKSNWERQEVDPDEREEPKHNNLAKKSTKKILFLYKRSTNQLLPVRDNEIDFDQNSKPNTQQEEIQRDQKQQNHFILQSQNENELDESHPLHNLSKNAINRAEDEIESRPPSLIFDQNEMFEAVSPMSTPHSRGIQRKDNQLTVLAKLDSINAAFRTNLQDIKDNISRIQPNKYNQGTVSYLTQQAQQRQIALKNNHLLSRLLLQGAPSPLQEHLDHIVDPQSSQQATNRQEYSQQVKEEDSMSLPEIQLTSLDQVPKEASVNAPQPQSKPVEKHQVSEIKHSGPVLGRREWSLEQDRVLLNFREQPNDYRLEMKCMLRYVGIDAIMDRYPQLNCTINEQSYEVIQEMIDSLK